MRSDYEILKQTNELAGKFMHMAYGREVASDYLFYKSDDPRSKACWEMAVLAQDMLTQTEVDTEAEDEESLEVTSEYRCFIPTTMGQAFTALLRCVKEGNYDRDSRLAAWAAVSYAYPGLHPDDFVKEDKVVGHVINSDSLEVEAFKLWPDLVTPCYAASGWPAAFATLHERVTEDYQLCRIPSSFYYCLTANMAGQAWLRKWDKLPSLKEIMDEEAAGYKETGAEGAGVSAGTPA